MGCTCSGSAAECWRPHAIDATGAPALTCERARAQAAWWSTGARWRPRSCSASSWTSLCAWRRRSRASRCRCRPALRARPAASPARPRAGCSTTRARGRTPWSARRTGTWRLTSRRAPRAGARAGAAGAGQAGAGASLGAGFAVWLQAARRARRDPATAVGTGEQGDAVAHAPQRGLAAGVRPMRRAGPRGRAGRAGAAEHRAVCVMPDAWRESCGRWWSRLLRRGQRARPRTRVPPAAQQVVGKV
jgi:hypothetical protein